MSKKGVRTLDGGRYSPWQVLDAANAYYELSTAFTAKLPRNMVEVELSAPRMDEAGASATNRVLALELYLKALLIATNSVVPKEHDLKTLFDAVPKEARNTVKQYFDDYSKLDAGTNVSWELEICFQLGLEINEVPRHRVVPTDPSLSALLVRNRHGFVVSRYLFENARADKASFFDYEYRRLAIICRVLCEALENSLLNRSPHYKRKFQFV